MSLIAMQGGLMSAGGGGGGDSDPFFDEVVALLHFDGANESTTFTDVIGNTWTNTGSPIITTAESKFGGASGDLTGTARIDASSTNFNFGTGDYTLEIWFRPDNNTNRAAFSFGARLVYTASGNWAYFNGSGNVIQGSSAVAGVWYHIALCRAESTTRLFINGVAVNAGISEVTAINAGALRVGQYNAGNPGGRYYDEFRVTRAARYTANFTPPAAPFPDA